SHDQHNASTDRNHSVRPAMRLFPALGLVALPLGLVALSLGILALSLGLACLRCPLVLLDLLDQRLDVTAGLVGDGPPGADLDESLVGLECLLRIALEPVGL